MSWLVILASALCAATEPAAPTVFAHAAPQTQEEAIAVLEAYAQSPATLLLLTPTQPLNLAEDALARPGKPVLSADTAGVLVLGEDAVLSIVPDPTGAGDGQALEQRREHRASRWSIGIMTRYTPYENYRMDLVLLREEPLDYLFVAESNVLAGAMRARSPFGPTEIIGPPQESETPLQLYQISATGLAPWAPPPPEEPPVPAE